MRSLLALGLLIALSISADAATVHRAGHLRARQPVIVRPSSGMIDPGPGQTIRAPARFSVPGWTDGQTQHWLDSATSCAGCG
jgi:hypothetical protein